MILASEGPKIFSTTSSCYLSKPTPTHLSFAITVYPNCVLVIINEAGSVGSIVIFPTFRLEEQRNFKIPPLP